MFAKPSASSSAESAAPLPNAASAEPAAQQGPNPRAADAPPALDCAAQGASSAASACASKRAAASLAPARRDVAVRRAVLTLLAGGAAAQLLPLLLGPLIARLYSPEAMGHYTAVAVWASTLAVVLGGRFEFALPLAKSQAEAEGLLALSLRIALVFLMGMVIFSLLIWRISGDTHWMWLGLMPLAWLMAWVQLRVMWATRAERFSALAASRFVQYGGAAVLQVLLGWWWLRGSGQGSAPASGFGWLLLAQGLALWAAAMLLGKPAPRAGWWRAWRAPPDAPPLRELARRHRDFPLINAPHAFLGTLQDALAVALILAITGDAAAGFWGLALRYVKAPAALVGQAVSQAVYPKLAKLGVAQGRQLVRKLLLLLGGLGLLGGALLMAFGPALFALAFGEAWRPAGELARALAPYIAVHFVAAPLAVVTMAWQAQAWAFKLALLGQAVFLLALGVGLWWGGLQGAAWAVSLGMLPYFAWYFWKLATWPSPDAAPTASP